MNIGCPSAPDPRWFHAKHVIEVKDFDPCLAGRVERLTAEGARDYIVHTPIEFNEDQYIAASFISFLQHSIANGLRVNWSMAEDPSEYLVRRLSHLPPPSNSGMGATTWRANHTYGQLYWRQGPSFVMIKDVRPSFSHSRILLSDEDDLQLHAMCQQPVLRTAAYGEGLEGAVDRFIFERLLLTCGEWLVGLSYRMRRWPIPYTAV